MNPENYTIYREMAKWKQSSPRACSIRNLINHNINPVLSRSDNSLPASWESCLISHLKSHGSRMSSLRTVQCFHTSLRIHVEETFHECAAVDVFQVGSGLEAASFAERNVCSLSKDMP